MKVWIKRKPQLRRYQPFGNGGPTLDGHLQSYQKKSPRKNLESNVSRQKCLRLRSIIYEIIQQHVPLQPRPIKYQSTMTIKNSVDRQEFLENTVRQTINMADLSRALLASASPTPKSNTHTILRAVWHWRINSYEVNKESCFCLILNLSNRNCADKPASGAVA